MQYARNVWPNLFACNENSAYIIPRVTTHAVMSCAHCVAHARRQVRHPYKCGTPNITYGHAVGASRTILIKIYCYTF